MEDLIAYFTNNKEIIFIVILMVFVGVEVIGNVPAVLHTPLMSGANAIHGVVIIGAILVMLDSSPDNYLALSLRHISRFSWNAKRCRWFCGNGPHVGYV